MCGICLLISDDAGAFDVDLSTTQSQISRRGPDHYGEKNVHVRAKTLKFAAGVLRIQGSVDQPLQDKDGNILLWNGEVFGSSDGTLNKREACDSLLVAEMLAACAGDAADMADVLANIYGPFAFVFYHRDSESIFYARDPFGRRSLLRWVSADGTRTNHLASTPLRRGFDEKGVWQMQEVPIDGVFRMNIEDQCHTLVPYPHFRLPARRQAVYAAGRAFRVILTEAISCRVRSLAVPWKDGDGARVGVLFSGGVDSVLLAALLHECLPEDEPVDLINVSFVGDCSTTAGRKASPDRLAAILALVELQELFPSRNWRLVHVDVSPDERAAAEPMITELICPSDTHMDLNIGTAFWFAARGKGYVHEKGPEPYRLPISTARVLLVGIGADEQMAGYGRHRTAFLRGGVSALASELDMDLDRLHSRNLGRDDRCLTDHGREAWFPYIDENVVSLLHSLSLHEIADLNEPQGHGDKRILRNAARLVGLKSCSELVKRAVQFGTGIAKQTNVREFGSNRKGSGQAKISGS
eukprot:GSChrysophyteH1.ASY1.ANO1.2830.1 assembled CDS